MSLLKRTPEFRALALAILVASIALVVTMGASPSSSKIDAIKTDLLFNEFQDPPDSAAPRVWWHWIDGNVTKEGIRRDLEWMDRVGLGGFQAFDVTMVTPQVVDERLVYMTPAWNEALRYATELARERDLEMAIASSPGWSVTGGPWVKPEQAMKKLVWSKLEIEGGQRFSGVLPQPPRIIGPFQDLPRKASMLLGPPKEHDQYYEDVAVIAYPVSQLEQASFPIVSVSSDDDIDYSILTDGLVSNGVQLEFGPEVKPTCLVYDYQHETAVASLLLATPIGNDFFHSATSRSVLEASSDGVDFKKVADVPGGGFIQHTITFDPVSARYFRICFRPPPPPFTDLLFTAVPGVARLSVGGNEPPSSFEINELQLFSTPRVHRAEEKAGFAHVNNYYAFPTPTITQENPISLEDVIDLTDYMRPDGTLDWQAPEGRWLIYRFGCTLTGSENAPAVPEGRGLEVDKLDADHVRKYLDDYLSMYEAAVGEDNVGNNGIRALLVDSYEAGAQNWTRSLPTEFKSRRGYELTPWMPTLAGMLVGSAEDSDRFLYDFRLTIGELLAENHFRTIAATAHARSMIQYGEAYEQARPGLGDSMALQRYTDVPMAALWTYRPERNVRTAHVADIRGSASVAHIYGQNIVAAEALTASYAPWAFSPRDLKPVIDLGFALGINRPVIHTSVHQPLLDKVPGLTLLIFGQYFNRNETWAEQAGAWVSYLARTSYLLQQGRYAADIVYFYGEEAPLTALFSEQGAPDMPSTVGFDFANADVVLNQLQVDRGDLVTEGGMRYRLLFLGGTSEQMTLPVLRRIGELINEGATVVGDMPTATPSLADDQEAFSALAHEIWNGADTGKGRIIAGQDVRAALDSLGVRPDFQYEEPSPDSEIMFLHRRLDDGDIYFLTNRTPRSESIQGRFRVSGKRPEIWHAETGQRQAVSYSIENGITTVPLSFDPHEAFFVVFRDAADQPELVVPEPTVEPLSSLDGKWEVRFEAGRGGPESPRDLEIGSWAEHEDAAIRYFSGTATYSRNIDVPQEWLDGAGRIELDMGDVRELVEVSLNGTSLGVSWRPPYRVDLTDALQAGKNQLELEVTNLWVNRLIGDAGNEGPKHTFTILPSYLPDAPLRASGLIGPVRIERVGPGGLIN